jgi:DNA-binding response OmpR family regulator
VTQHEQILVVDDEANIRLTLSTLLRRAGYDVYTAENGKEAVALLEQHMFDLLLVDLRMPEMDGMEVVAAARERQPEIAVIVLTGHGSLETAVEGLHQGIFDYLLKTTEPRQVIERVKAGLAQKAQQRRQRTLLDVLGSAVHELRGSPTPEPTESGASVITVGALQLNVRQQAATLDGRVVPLTPTEFRVLLCLAEQAGNMVSYAQLVRSAQGYDASEHEAGELIKPHIRHLRQKLEPDAAEPRYILNVRGKGYLLSPVGE